MRTAALFCPQCTSPVAEDDEFCPDCGDFLGWRPEPVDVPEVVLAPPPAEDRLDALRHAQADTAELAQAAQAKAAQAQVRLERVRRRSASASRRLERLQSELPAAKERAREADVAAGRAAASAQRAKAAVKKADGPRKEQLQLRAREAGRADRRAKKANQQAQEALATLSGVVAGVVAEVDQAPTGISGAKKARDVARREAAKAVLESVSAAAELALQEKLLSLRATPRRVVGLPAQAEQELREQAEREADEASREAQREATATEKEQLREAAREDEDRAQAEQQADERELGEVLAGAERAAEAAEDADRAGAVETPAAVPAAALSSEPPARQQPGALSPVEVRRRARRQAATLATSEDGPMLCPSCGTGNAEERHLCRLCGTRLHVEPEAPVTVVRLSWWRRVLRLGPPRKEEESFIPAGARPVPGGNRSTAAAVRRARVGGASALRRSRRQRLVAGGVAATGVVVLATALLTPVGGRVVDTVKGGSDRVKQRAGHADGPLVPLRTKASSTGRTSAPALAFDGDPTTSWTAGRAPGTGQQLIVSLATPADLVAVRLTAAAGLGRPRPASVTVIANGQEPVVVRLKDDLDAQRLPVRLDSVQTVRLVIGDVYPGSAPGLGAGFAEVQLLGRT